MHKPVLLQEVIEHLFPKSPNLYIDATVGAGGHAEKILEESGPEGKLVGIDIDPYMLNIARDRLKKFGNRCLLFENNFVNLYKICPDIIGANIIEGIIFDLGVASEHFDIPERGFSIKREGPLDMRLNPHSEISAEHIVNEWGPEDLINILFQYGEERQAKRITREIIAERKRKRITTTAQLAGIIERAVSYKKKSKVRGYRIHPATKTFQALRIVVNSELKNIEEVLPVAVDLLKTGGRLCVISFHSLEDRLVKNTFRSLARRCICPPEVPKCVCENKPKIKIITKKPVIPGKEEMTENPRARSAKLRVVEKI